MKETFKRKPAGNISLALWRLEEYILIVPFATQQQSQLSNKARQQNKTSTLQLYPALVPADGTQNTATAAKPRHVGRNTMRFLSSLLFFSLIFSCQDQSSLIFTNDVLIVSYPANFEGRRIVITDTNKVVRFTKEFWDYFLQSHPRVAMTIFAAHRYEEHYPYYNTGDSLYTYYEIGIRSGNLGLALADSAGHIEKAGVKEGTVWKQDSSGRPLPYNPRSMTLSKSVASEFNKFKRILSSRDTLTRYVILYKSDFLPLD